MTRKKFCKTMMAFGFQRNDAKNFVRTLRTGESYKELAKEIIDEYYRAVIASLKCLDNGLATLSITANDIAETFTKFAKIVSR